MEIIKKISAKNADIVHKKPATIAFLGDSVTQGCFECYLKLNGDFETIFDTKNSYVEKVKIILNYLYPSAQINVINSGISGDRATSGVLRFERDIAPFSPDLVVVGYALNDCWWDVEEYANALISIFKKTKAIGAECIFLTPNVTHDKVSPFLQEEKFKKMAADTVVNRLEDFVVAAKEAARKEGVAVCDVYEVWKRLRENGVDTTELLSNKLNHPAREMHWMTAYKLVETMFEK